MTPQRVWEQHGGEGELTNFRIYGMAEAYTFVQALQAAGPNPTRDGIVEALEQIGSELQGPGFSPFRYSAESHAGMSRVKVTRITGNTTDDLAPVLVTDNGDAPITEYQGRNAPPPPNVIPQVEPVG